MLDLLQNAAFFLGAGGAPGVRSAARPGNSPSQSCQGYRIPHYHGQVFAYRCPKIAQTIENDVLYCASAPKKSD
jgi:hypothetical protein